MLYLATIDVKDEGLVWWQRPKRAQMTRPAYMYVFFLFLYILTYVLYLI